LLIDEVSRQTLLFTDGRPSHRQRGERFIDSLCMVKNEPLRTVRFAVGFDVPAPIDSLRSLIAPPNAIPCNAPAATPASGWLVHCSTPDVVICDLQTESTAPLVISFLAIASRSESRKAKIRFCRNIVSATQDANDLKYTGDAIEVPLAGFEVAQVRVELNAS